MGGCAYACGVCVGWLVCWFQRPRKGVGMWEWGGWDECGVLEEKEGGGQEKDDMMEVESAITVSGCRVP